MELGYSASFFLHLSALACSHNYSATYLVPISRVELFPGSNHRTRVFEASIIKFSQTLRLTRTPPYEQRSASPRVPSDARNIQGLN